MKKKTIFKVVGYYLLIVLGLFLILTGYNWYLLKQNQVRLGLARPDFPYTKYSQEELNKMYPQVLNENVPTRQTPEETYAKFIAALKGGDVEGAMKWITSRNYKEYLDVLNKAKQDKKMDEILMRLEYPIKSKEVYSTMAIYIFDSKERVDSILEFIKDSNGDWKIDSL